MIFTPSIIQRVRSLNSLFLKYEKQIFCWSLAALFSFCHPWFLFRIRSFLTELTFPQGKLTRAGVQEISLQRVQINIE